VIEINGKQLRDYLETTSNYYLVNTEAITPLVNRSWPGYNFDTVNSYRAEGGGGFTMLAGSPVTWRSDVSVKQIRCGMADAGC
jgi:hypothetical protein